MQRYIVRRVLQMLVSLLLLSIVVFILVRLSGDPVILMIPVDATPEMEAGVRHDLGLDKPMPVQYLYFLRNVLKGDFGRSYNWRQPAFDVVIGRLPATLQLSAAALLLALMVGIPLGVLAAVKRGSVWDWGARVLALAGQALPGFWVGIMLILVFSVSLGWLPTSGREGPLHFIMPTVTLGLFPIAAITRLNRSSMLNVLSADYIKNFRLLGAPERVILFKHALKNAAIPVVTYAVLLFGALLRGAVITETVFAWPGVGRLSVQAVLLRDFPTIQAVILMVGAMILTLNLTLDVLYAYLDPRIRYG